MFLQRLMLVMLTGAFISFVGCNSSQPGNPNLETEIDTVSYSIGYQNGMMLNQQNLGDINLDIMVEGMRDALNDSVESPIPEHTMRGLVQSYMMKKEQEAAAQRQEEAEVNKKEAHEFLTQNKQKEDVIETESGLQYKVLEEGSGASPAADDTVTVHYTGTLLDGTQFDSSRDGEGEPVDIPLNRVIPGWTEGLQLMSEGATYKFWIPSELGYGDNPNPNSPIRPGSTIVFEVELIEVL